MSDDASWKFLGLFLWTCTAMVSLARLFINANHYTKLTFNSSTKGCLPTLFSSLFSCCTNKHTSDTDFFRIMQQNLWFHLLSFLGSLLEVPKYIFYIWGPSDPDDDPAQRDDDTNSNAPTPTPTSDDSYSVSIYPLHLVSLLCIYFSFCIIINLWGSAIVFEAKDSRKASMLRAVLGALCSVDFVLVLIVIFKCFQTGSMDTLLDTKVYRVLTYYQTSGMVVLAAFFLCFGYAAQRKIWRTFTRSDGWKSDTDFYMGLIRLNVIIAVCFLCFTAKAVCLFALAQKHGSTDSTTENPFFNNVMVWYFVYEWIPDIVPRLALLYLMSRNLSDAADDRAGMSTSGEIVRGSGGFSEERFISFDRETERGDSGAWVGASKDSKDNGAWADGKEKLLPNGPSV